MLKIGEKMKENQLIRFDLVRRLLYENRFL